MSSFCGLDSPGIEFGRNLVAMLGGEDSPPVGLIQSAIGGTQIEAWSPNATTAKCQNKTAGGPTAGSVYFLRHS